MQRRILSLILTMGLIASAVYPISGHAATSSKSSSSNIDKQLEEVKRQQEASKKRVQDAQKQLGSVKVERKQTQEDIAALNDQIKDTYDKLNNLEDQLGSTEEELAKQAQQLDEAEARVAQRKALLESRMRLIYTNGTVSYLDVLFSAASFSDFLSRLDALTTIFGQDQDILESNRRDRDIVDKKKQEVAATLTQLKGFYDETTNLKIALQAKEHDKEVRVAALDKQQGDLEKISDDEEKRVIELARKQSQLLAEKNKSQTAFSGGKFAYPLAKQAPITSGFGSRTNPVTGQKGEFHKGLDFGAPQGTSILAADDGVVILAGAYSGYGNCVIINHGKDKSGNEIWTLYGHIRNGGIKVSKGDKVKRGQKIAEVGATGQATGPHLHFEVRVNETVVNPTSYLK